MACPKGKITRKGYMRGDIKVKRKCITAQSVTKRTTLNAPILKKMRNRCNTKKFKCNILFHLEKGTLSKFGYSMKNTMKKRHISLKRAIKKIEPLSVYRKLNALYVLNKNKHPKNAHIFKKDAEWIKKLY